MNEFEKYIKSMSLNDIIIKLSGTHDYVEFVDNEWEKLKNTKCGTEILKQGQKWYHGKDCAKILSAILLMEETNLNDFEIKEYLRLAILHDIKKNEQNHDIKGAYYLLKNFKRTISDERKYILFILACNSHSDKTYVRHRNIIKNIKSITKEDIKMSMYLAEADLLCKLIYPVGAMCATDIINNVADYTEIERRYDKFFGITKEDTEKDGYVEVMKNDMLYSKSAKYILYKHQLHLFSR